MDEKIKNNLIILLKLFKNKPQYLIKFFLNNNAFTEQFLTKVFNSNELNKLKNTEKEDLEDSEDIFSELPHFKSINDMNKYFMNIINTPCDIKEDNIYEKINKDLEKNLKKQLRESIKSEDYEKAAELRDRMEDLNIKFKM